ncbi:hypothetical protein B0O99DRAFT_715281 [Bisporella sp. PMI_857]|nr:hypothetical protein B0O99DRAFT_715281 [Bisporella sp. PMI_857]
MYPGTVDEKLSSEAGTYVWMQDRCPDVRIPQLYGFGFSDRRYRQKPFYFRLWHMFQRYLRNLFRCPTVSHYTAYSDSQQLPTAYLLPEYVGPSTGQMLSNTWEKHRNDPFRKQKLFRGMARLILSLTHIPQPRINSFQFYKDGAISLINRLLLCSVIIFENDGAPRTIQRNETYTCTSHSLQTCLHFMKTTFLAIQTQFWMLKTAMVKWRPRFCLECSHIITSSGSTEWTILSPGYRSASKQHLRRRRLEHHLFYRF